MNIVFFGTTTDSVIVLDRLVKLSDSIVPRPDKGRSMKEVRVAAAVTQPARPVGRKQIITKTPVHARASELGIPVYTFACNKDKPWLYADEADVIGQLSKLDYDMVVSACYGQKIPMALIQSAKYGGLNVHPSLLPRWRGADPVPWAILYGDTHVGVTVVTLEERFDSGQIIAQKKYKLPADAYPDPVRTHLFKLGAEILCSCLPINESNIKGIAQDLKKTTYAGRMNRQTGYVPWELVELAMSGDSPSTFEQWRNVVIINTVMKKLMSGQDRLAAVLERSIRALSPWPGVWSLVNISNQKANHGRGKKRLKLISAHLSTNTKSLSIKSNSPTLVLDQVQLEGKQPVKFAQFKRAYLL